MSFTRRFVFPDPETADASGLVAVTRELNTELLLEAYSRGIFPWSEHPVRWFCPDPRAVFVHEYARIPRKIGKAMRRRNLRVTFDQAFERVIRACSDSHRDSGEWISRGFIRAYSEFHKQGFAHSVEVWQDERLVGGLYGVHIGAMFAGESMFHDTPNASKVAFAYLMKFLRTIGVVLIDAQVLNAHTASLGAVLVNRHDFLHMLGLAVKQPNPYSGREWPTEPGFEPPTRSGSGA